MIRLLVKLLLVLMLSSGGRVSRPALRHNFSASLTSSTSTLSMNV